MVVKVKITKEQLEDIYLTKNYTREATAQYFGVKPRYIKGLVLKYGLGKSQELINKNNKGGTSIGYHWWTDGKEQVFCKDWPGEGWVKGRLESFKRKVSGSHSFSEEVSSKLSKLASERFSGCELSDEHKQKISDYWKEHTHPLKGKERPDDIKSKISKALCQESTDENVSSDVVSFKADVLEYIKSIYKGTVKENVKDEIIPGEIDIYIPDEKLCIECNGCYWHRTEYVKEAGKFTISGGKSTSYHFQKSKQIREKGLRLIHIWEDQWKNERLQPILKGIIKAALNLLDTEKIYARQCVLKEVPAKEYKDFCNSNHTQLTRPAEIRLGLYYKGRLVQVASFGKYKAGNRTNVNDKNSFDYEWIRGCESFNHSHVIGGVSKLFKHFLAKYNPNTILCYSDFNFFNGIGYNKCGFELKGYTGSDKFYIDSKTFTRINRSAKHYKEYMENVVNGDWYCCYGAGSLKFVWTKPTK